MKTPFAITLGVGSGLANLTGGWRMQRPVFEDRMPPCNDACPTGENVQRWLYHAAGDDFEAAWREMVADNPFPAISGRVCDHPCESVCHRVQMDGEVDVHNIETFLGERAIAERWAFPDIAPAEATPVLIVGSGPCGLSAAYHLRRWGHPVTIREAASHPGGRLRRSVDEGVLPRQTLDAEIDRVLALGIQLELGSEVSEAPAIGPGQPFGAVLFTSPSRGGRVPPPGPGLFDAEDCCRDLKIVESLGAGKKAARLVHDWLTGNESALPPRLDAARFEHLNTWYYTDAPRSPQLDSNQVIDAARALYESRRCLSCGGCFECDNCFSVCPDNAVVKLGPGRNYEFDMDYCKGCGICVTECPSGAIAMKRESA